MAHAVFELERPDRAEVAFAVADEMQGRGLATVLIAHLAQVASARGVDDVHRHRAAREPAHDQRLPRVRLPGRGARLAGRDRDRVPDRAGRRRAAQLRGPRPRGRRGRGRAGAAAAVGRGHRRVAAPGLVRRRSRSGTRSPTASAASSTRSTRTRTSSAAARGARATTPAVDLAIVAVPAETVPDVARECAQAGVAALVVITAGFAEAGAGGRRAAGGAAGGLPRERDAAGRPELHGGRQHRIPTCR